MRALRIFRRVVVAALATGVTALITLALFLQSDCGQERVRRWAESRMSGAVNGSASISSAHLSLAGELELEGVVLSDVDGRALVTADSLALEFDWLPLLSRELHVTTASVRDFAVHSSVNANGEVDLATLFASGGEPSSWAVTVNGVAVTGGSVSIARPGALPITLTEVEVSARLRNSRAHAEVFIERLAATWREEELRVAGKTHLRVTDGSYTARAVDLQVGDTRVVSPWLRADVAADTLIGVIAITAPARDLQRIPVAGLQSFRADVDLDMMIVCRQRSLPCAVNIWADIAGGKAIVSANVDRELTTVDGRAELRGVTLKRLLDRAPAIHIDELVFDGGSRGWSVAELHGSLAASGRAEIEGVTISSATLEAERVAGGPFTASASAKTAYGSGLATVAVDRQATGDWVLEDAQLTAEIPDLGRLASGLEVSGRAKLNLSARGQVSAVDVEANADIWALEAGTATAERVHVSVETSGLSLFETPAPLSGTVSSTARGVRVRETELGNLTARGRFHDYGRALSLRLVGDDISHVQRASSRAVARLDAELSTLSVRLTDTTLSAADVTWKGRGGTIVIGPADRVDLRDLELQSAAGRVIASGRLESGHRVGRAKLELRDLDLARVPPSLFEALGLPAQLAGEAVVEGSIATRGGQIAANGSVTVTGLSWRPAQAPIDANAVVAATPRQLSLSASASGRRLGSIMLATSMRTPTTLFDPDSWRTVTLADVDDARIEVDDLAVAEVSDMLARELPLTTGQVSGTLVLPAAGSARSRTASFDLRCTEAELAGVADLSARIKGNWNDLALAGRVTVDQRGARVFSGPVSVKLGLEKSWSAEIGTTSIDGTLALDELALARLNEVGLVAIPLTGELSGDLVLAGTLGEPVIELRRGTGNNIGAGGLRLAHLTIGARLQRSGLGVTALGVDQAGGRLHGTMSYPFTAQGQLSGKFHFARVTLENLRGLAKTDLDLLSDISGRLDGDLELAGSPTAPKVTGRVSVVDGQLLLEEGARPITKGSLDLRFTPDRLHVDRLSFRSGAGRVSGKGTVELEHLSPGDFTLAFTVRDFPMTVGETDATASLEGVLLGELRGRRVIATAIVDRGKVWLARSPRALQNLGPLEDVVFVSPDRRPSHARDAEADIELHVVVDKGVKIRSDELDAVVKARLKLAFRDGMTSYLAGSVDVVRGSYELLDRRYRIRRGHVEFDGVMPPDPAIDILLWRQFPAAGVSVTIAGTLDEPRGTLSADDGGYDDTQVMVIMLGEDPDDPDIADRPVRDQAMGVAGALLSREFDKHLRVIDVLRVSNDSVEIGRWITDDLLVGYRERLGFDEGDNLRELTFEYRLFRRVLVEGRYGANNFGNDLVWVIRW